MTERDPYQPQLVYVAAVLALCVFAVGAWFVTFLSPRERVVVDTPSVIPDEGVRTPYAELMVDNPAFAEGDRALREKNYPRATELLLQALSQAKDAWQHAAVKMAAAEVIDAQHGPVDAIRVYKEVAANESYPLYMRARAVQAMGELFYRRGDEAVFEAIFADEPYRSMTEGANSGLALRRLHEYAASLYPLALSELRIANRYATILINPESDRAVGPEASLSVYAGIVNESLARAKADIARMKEAQHPENEHIADVYTLLGVVLGKLFVTGRVEEHDANAAFESALLYYARADARGRTGIDGMARFYYAQHLTRDMFEGAHDEDARAIIAPLSSESYQGSFLYAFLVSEKGNVLGNRQSIRRLAALDPAFRQLLLSLGWEERNLPTAQ